MTLIEEWRHAFLQLDSACPWPGPRPMSTDRYADDPSMLVGRRRDTLSFIEKVRKNSLVVLHADSGVGKSSLLENGLVPELDKQGFQVFVCWNWTETVGRPGDLDEVMAEVIRETDRPIEGVDFSNLSGRDVIDQLEQAYQDKVVFVLDQFEELIRYQPERFAETVRWVLDINRHRRIRVVLSLRSEYLHRLKPIDAGARPYSMDRLDLEPIGDRKRILQIITGPNAQGERITEAAATGLAEVWEKLPESSPYRGLLHLQAVLYALHDIATQAGRAAVDVTDVAMLAAKEPDRTVFEAGLNHAIGLKLDRCIAACSDESVRERIDELLRDGTHALVRSSVGRLSSGGYKLIREEWNLAEEVLDRELDILAPESPGKARADRESRTEAEKIYFAMADDLGREDFDLLATGWAEIEAAIYPDATAQPEISAYARYGVDPAPWLSDRDDVSCGPMMGASPRAVIIEELRRFLFAVEWLETASLVRTTTTAPGQTMLSLIHDGFGEALERWVGRNRIGPDAALAMITAAEGERLDFSEGAPVGGWVDFTGGMTAALMVNMRWRNCDITSDFDRVVFVNCDFRGSRFTECLFKGAVFVNCLLDAATFEDCTIQGAVTAPPKPEELTRQELRELPSFAVPASPEVIRLLNRYRGTDVQATQLLSPTSGVPAVPFGDITIDLRDWLAQDGGLTMYGGRLSSLSVRRCRFIDEGEVSLRHIAGSSLDIVEQSEGSIELFDSTVRGMSITKPVDEPADPTKRLLVNLSGCILADTWFGEGLYGDVLVEDSVVWHLTNLSQDSGELTVRIEDCQYHNVINVASIDDGSLRMTGIAEAGIAEPDLIVRAGRRMAFRRFAARYELERLLQRAYEAVDVQ